MPRPALLNRDAGQELKVQQWVKELVGEWPEEKTYDDALKDGILLCRVMNVISPGAVNKINMTGAGFKLMENIVKFQEALTKYGVDKEDIFQTNDLFEKKDLGAVTNTMFALDRAVGKAGDWTGPRLV